MALARLVFALLRAEAPTPPNSRNSDMDAIDRSAMAAAWQAVADAQLILDQLPNLSTKEIEAVIGSKLVEANRDWMQSYIPAEAAAAFRKAVGEVCKEIESGSIAHSTTDDSG